MTDAELEAWLDELGATEEQRVAARRILAKQRAAEEAERVAAEREFAAFAHLPRYVRRTMTAEGEGLRLRAEGRDLDAIERHLFNGLPRDARTIDIVRRVRELSSKRGFGRCRSGTLALAAALGEAADRATDAAQVTFTKIRNEADTFGHNRADDMLRAAGLIPEELTNE
jgi:hypothetical protein